MPKREKAKILAAMQSVNARLAERTLPSELTDETQLMNAVIKAHMETCDFTRDKVDILMSNAHRQPDYTTCPATLVSHLLMTSRTINWITLLTDRYIIYKHNNTIVINNKKKKKKKDKAGGKICGIE